MQSSIFTDGQRVLINPELLVVRFRNTFAIGCVRNSPLSRLSRVLGKGNLDGVVLSHIFRVGNLNLFLFPFAVSVLNLPGFRPKTLHRHHAASGFSTSRGYRHRLRHCFHFINNAKIVFGIRQVRSRFVCWKVLQIKLSNHVHSTSEIDAELRLIEPPSSNRNQCTCRKSHPHSLATDSSIGLFQRSLLRNWRSSNSFQLHQQLFPKLFAGFRKFMLRRLPQQSPQLIRRRIVLIIALT